MALGTRRIPALLAFATDSTHTPGVEVEAARFIGVRCPVAIAITFEGCFDAAPGAPTPVWSPIRDTAGAAIGFTTVANAFQPLPDACLAYRWIRAVTPAQGSNQLFEFSVKEDK